MSTYNMIKYDKMIQVKLHINENEHINTYICLHTHKLRKAGFH